MENQRDVTPRTELAEARLAAGFTQQALADQLSAALSTVRTWERGTRSPLPRQRQPLANALGISLNALHYMLTTATQPPMNGHTVPRWLNTYESLVQEAGHLSEVEFIAIPGLLQTKAYTEAAEYASGVPLTDDQVLAAVDRRVARQSVLHREVEPLRLTVVLSEGVLRDPVGGPGVMVEQLDRLIELSHRPNIDLRLIGPGRAVSAISGFELLTRRGDRDPFMAVTASIDGPHYIEVEERVAKFVSRFNHLATTALSTDETLRRLREIRDTHSMENHQ